MKNPFAVCAAGLALGFTTYSDLQAQPDLVVTSASVQGAVQANRLVQVRVTVRNDGNVHVSSEVATMLGESTSQRASDFRLGAFGVSLLPGASQTLTIFGNVPGHLVGGRWFLRAIADPTNVVAERSERNNVALLFVDVIPVPETTRLIEYQPRLNSIATHPRTVVVPSNFGGSANLAVYAPQFAHGQYLCAWSCTSTFALDGCTQFSLALLNGPIMPRWFGTLDATGRAFPGLDMPPIPGFDMTVFTHAFFLSADGTRFELSDGPIALGFAPGV